MAKTAIEALEDAANLPDTKPNDDKPESQDSPVPEPKPEQPDYVGLIKGDKGAEDNVESLKEEVRRLRRDHILAQTPKENREAMEQLLDLKDAVDYVEVGKKDLADRERKIAVRSIADEYKDYGVTADILEDAHDEKAMRKLAEHFKTVAKPEESSSKGNPPAMQDKPSAGASGTAVAPSPVEKHKRTGKYGDYVRDLFSL